MATPTYTLQDLYNQFYGILKEDEGVSQYPLTMATSFLNMAQNAICDGTLQHPTTKEGLKKPFLNFLSVDKFYSSVQYTTVSATATVGGTTLDAANTSDFASSGVIYVNGDVITYTGKTATQFTGCSGIGFAHIPGDRIWQIYSLPADFNSPVRATYDARYEMIAIDQRDVVTELRRIGMISPEGTAYSSWNNLVTQGMYWIIDGQYIATVPNSDTGKMIQFTYQKSPTQMSATTDLCTVPDKYSLTTIPYIAVGEMLFNRGEEQRGLTLWQIGMSHTKQMYDWANVNNKEQAYNQRVRNPRDRSFYNI